MNRQPQQRFSIYKLLLNSIKIFTSKPTNLSHQQYQKKCEKVFKMHIPPIFPSQAKYVKHSINLRHTKSRFIHPNKSSKERDMNSDKACLTNKTYLLREWENNMNNKFISESGKVEDQGTFKNYVTYFQNPSPVSDVSVMLSVTPSLP